jgi:membrane-associated phospholipid phosphatase
VRTRLALLAVTAALSVWLTYRTLVTTTAGQRLDQFVMVGSMANAPVEASHLQQLLHAVSMPSVAVAIAALAAVAVRRARPDLAVAATATVAGANLTTQALKRWLDRPDLLDLGSANSFPSGHVTVVASLAAAAVLVSSRRAQPVVVAVGLAATAVTAVATVALGWHRPSDVVGAAGVVVAWSAAAAAWTARRPLAPPPSEGRAALRSVA